MANFFAYRRGDWIISVYRAQTQRSVKVMIVRPEVDRGHFPGGVVDKGGQVVTFFPANDRVRAGFRIVTGLHVSIEACLSNLGVRAYISVIEFLVEVIA